MVVRGYPAWLYIAAILCFLVIGLLPLLVMVGPWLWQGIDDPHVLRTALLDARQWGLLTRSLGLGLSVVALSAVLGVPLALLLSVRDLPLRRWFWLLVLVPLTIPPYVLAGAWMHVFSPLGAVNSWLTGCWGPEAGIKLQSLPGCVWCLGQSFSPLVTLLVATGLATLDRSVLESARLETNRWGRWRHVLWPQIRVPLLAALCLVLVFTLVQYSVPSLLGINTYPVEIFTQFSAFYNESAAIATSIPLVLLVMGLILAQRWIMGTREYVRLSPSSEGTGAWRRGPWRYGAALVLALWFSVAVLWPFGTVLMYAGGGRQVFETLRGHFDWLVYTSVLALAAAVMTTGIGFLLGHLLSRSQTRTLRLLDLLCWLPIAWPGTVMGLAYLKVGSMVPALQHWDTWGLLLLPAYVGMFSAFSVRIFVSGFRHADPHVNEMAALDCRHWLQRAWYIDCKQMTLSVSLSLMLVFVLVVGELHATVLLIPPGKTTLAVSIDNLLHYGASATASALCLLEAGLVLGTAALGLTWMRLMGRRYGT